jgi:hypothetical protein
MLSSEHSRGQCQQECGWTPKHWRIGGNADRDWGDCHCHDLKPYSQQENVPHGKSNSEGRGLLPQQPLPSAKENQSWRWDGMAVTKWKFHAKSPGGLYSMQSSLYNLEFHM